jgi:hypothetical protein
MNQCHGAQSLGADDALGAERPGDEHDREDRERRRNFVADDLGGGADAADQRPLVVRGQPAIRMPTTTSDVTDVM